MSTAAAAPVDRQQARIGRVDIPFMVIAVVTGVVLIYLGRSLTFFHDEWRSIAFDGDAVDYLRPVNEHWSTLPLLLYRATFEIVELRSYLPYLTEVIVLHLLAVAGAYAIVRARVGPFVATLVALPLLVLGSGAENLFWAFQTGFVGSVMFGVWALFFVERPGRHAPVIASLLLIGALAASGMGLFFLVAAAVRIVFDRPLRPRLLTVVPAAALYLVWYALFGHDAVGDTGPVAVDLSAVQFAVRGITFATETFLGFQYVPEGYLWGLLLFVVLSTMAGYRLVRGRRPAPLAIGCLLGLASLYALVAVVRADLEDDYANASRYVYVAAFFLVLAVVDLLPRQQSWPGLGRWTGLAAATAVGAALLLSTFANVDALAYQRSEFQYKADVTRSFVALAEAHADEQWVDTDVRLGVMPAVPELLDTIDRHGSPLADELVPGVVRPPQAAAKEAALLALVGSGFRVEPAAGSRARIQPVVVAATRVEVSEAGKCIRATARDVAGSLTVAVPSGARVRLHSSSYVAGSVRLGHDRSPSRRIDLDLEPGAPRDVVVPDVGDGRRWQVAVDFGAPSAGVVLCAHRADDART